MPQNCHYQWHLRQHVRLCQAVPVAVSSECPRSAARWSTLPEPEPGIWKNHGCCVSEDTEHTVVHHRSKVVARRYVDPQPSCIFRTVVPCQTLDRHMGGAWHVSDNGVLLAGPMMTGQTKQNGDPVVGWGPRQNVQCQDTCGLRTPQNHLCTVYSCL